MRNKSRVKIIIKTVLVTSIFTAMLTACKQEVGTSEDSPQKEEIIIEDKEQYTFIYSGINMDNSFYTMLESVIKESLSEDEHILITLDPQGDVEKQCEQIIETLENKEVNLIYLAPVDWELIQPAVEALSEAKVPIVNLDTQIKTTSIIDAFVGSDNVNAGKICGEHLMELYPEGAGILLIEAGKVNSVNERITGFEETVSKAGFHVVSRIDGEGNLDTTKSKLEKQLSINSDIEVIVCGNDQMAMAAYDLVRELKVDIKIMSIDGSPEIKQLIAENNSSIIGTVAQSPIMMGRTAVNVALAIIEGDNYEKTTKLETYYIDNENIDIYGSDSWQ